MNNDQQFSPDLLAAIGDNEYRTRPHDTVQSLFVFVFGDRVAGLEFSDREKLSLIKMAIKRMAYDRDVFRAGVLRLSREKDKLAQGSLF